ncbi:hypothetical protein CW304_24700 [Bacillus sp. UFRGS-B20]|nr:hypothetical protein CW304_24700 [Bacillus sp. UFRGS-B20]
MYKTRKMLFHFKKAVFNIYNMNNGRRRTASVTMVVVTSFIFLGKASKKRIGEMLKKYRDPYAVIKR